jgi:hypothetical protein
MEWCSIPPQLDGYYWWRLHAGVLAAPVGVAANDNTVFMIADEREHCLSTFGGEFYGPLFPPE